MALFGWISVHCIVTNQLQSVPSAMGDYLFGALGSACLSLAMLTSFVSGELYHRAIQPGKPTKQYLLRLGDLLGALAAFLTATALMTFGNATFALVAGSLLMFAKIGSFAFPPSDETDQNIVLNAVTFRNAAVASRFPSLGAVGLILLAGFSEVEVTSRVAVAAIMFLSYLFWLAGDWSLLMLEKVSSKSHSLPINSAMAA